VTFINRHFKANEWEGYIQDSWRVLPSVIVTYGVRYTLLQAPWEVNGQQIATTVDTQDWFIKRGEAAAQGQIYEPDLTFAPNGRANGKPAYWPAQKANLAPRLAIAFTLSKSIDMGSDAERASEASSNGSFSAILNSWKPALNRGVSDFDTRHLITLDWVYQAPFGRGKAFFASANRLLDAVVGGWQWSGLTRWTSGLPFSVIEPGWSTNWHIASYGVRTGTVKIRKDVWRQAIFPVF
jgi:hypothetical protein